MMAPQEGQNEHLEVETNASMRLTTTSMLLLRILKNHLTHQRSLSLGTKLMANQVCLATQDTRLDN